MNFAKINEYLQTLATFGAVIGLLLLGYEVRQTYGIADRELSSANWSSSLNSSLGLLNAGVSAAIEKSMVNPNDLTLREKIDLSLYYKSFTLHWSHVLATVSYREFDTDKIISDLQTTISDIAPTVFGSRHARAWLQVSKGSIFPPVYEAIVHGLRDAPLGSDRAYYERIDAVAASMD